jgi:hypothetical protein
MTGTSQGGIVTWLVALVMSCIVASGEVHGQGTSSTLVDSVADLLEVSQPSRELISADERGPGIAEDAFDQHLAQLMERHTTSKPLRALSRSRLTPTARWPTSPAAAGRGRRATRSLDQPRSSNGPSGQGKGHDGIGNRA